MDIWFPLVGISVSTNQNNDSFQKYVSARREKNYHWQEYLQNK